MNTVVSFKLYDHKIDFDKPICFIKNKSFFFLISEKCIDHHL